VVVSARSVSRVLLIEVPPALELLSPSARAIPDAAAIVSASME